jgi:hypothetical protein
MKKNILPVGKIFVAAVMAVLIAASVAPAASATPAKGKKSSVPAPIAQTGQTECWNASGEQIVCTDTGQDGDVQAGVVSPVPRFTDNNNGTVTDNLTGLTWLKDTFCLDLGDQGWATWEQALAAANNLQNGACGLSDGSVPGNWRLPNVRELLSLIDFGEAKPALPAGHPFIYSDASFGLQTQYWSSTTNAADPYYDQAYYIDFLYPMWLLSAAAKGNSLAVWPVKGGQ